MTQEYYIHSQNERQGPYDLVMLVRKIRNGLLEGSTPIQLGDSDEIKPAQNWPQLAEFFAEKRDEWAEASKHGQLQNHGLNITLNSGWRFLQHNQISTIFSGIFVLFVIMMTGAVYFILPPSLKMFAYLFGFVFLHFLLSCYLFSMLRMTRGQPIDIFYLVNKIGPKVQKLLLSSILISLPAIIGLALLTASDSQVISIVGLVIFAVPGLFTITLHSFAPLLIVDQDYGTLEAMSISRKSVIKSGIENIGVLFALFVINFTAGLFALLPLVITLPITMSALTEIYDEFFG